MWCSQSAWSATDDGFGSSAQVIPSQHFSVYIKPDVDVHKLLEQMSVSPTDQKLVGQDVDRSSADKELGSTLDVLLSRACDVLDMRLYSFKGNIKIFATQEQLQNFFNTKFHTKLPCTGVAFYMFDYNSIYISAENFRREVLGHEMGHAVMSNYFVVQPSEKIQEVLAGYVEYQLRKSK